MPHEVIIFTKFHEDGTKIVDFLLLANFCACAFFSYSELICMIFSVCNNSHAITSLSYLHLRVWFRHFFFENVYTSQLLADFGSKKCQPTTNGEKEVALGIFDKFWKTHYNQVDNSRLIWQPTILPEKELPVLDNMYIDKII